MPKFKISHFEGQVCHILNLSQIYCPEIFNASSHKFTENLEKLNKSISEQMIKESEVRQSNILGYAHKSLTSLSTLFVFFILFYLCKNKCTGSANRNDCVPKLILGPMRDTRTDGETTAGISTAEQVRTKSKSIPKPKAPEQDEGVSSYEMDILPV